jgi:hypothetical protein
MRKNQTMKAMLIIAALMPLTTAAHAQEWHTKDGKLASEDQYGPFISECVHEVRGMEAQLGRSIPDGTKVRIAEACMWNRGFYVPEMLK